LAYEEAIRRAHKTVWAALPSGEVLVTGSAALWLADREAKWLPDDVDIPVLAGMYYDLVGRLIMLGHKQVKPAAYGFNFEVPVKIVGRELAAINVQIYPVNNLRKTIAQHDLEAVRCWAVPAANLSMRVVWCDGIDPDKILRLRQSDYYHPTKACLCKLMCRTHGRNRMQKYQDRGYTLTPIQDGTVACPYCTATSGRPSWRLAGRPGLRVAKSPQVAINGLTLMRIGFEAPYTNKVALRWLEQQWIGYPGRLDRVDLLDLVTPAPPPCPVDGTVLRQHGVAPVDCGEYVREAQEMWLRSDCTLTTEELLVRLGVLTYDTDRFSTDEESLTTDDDMPELETDSGSDNDLLELASPRSISAPTPLVQQPSSPDFVELTGTDAREEVMQEEGGCVVM